VVTRTITLGMNIIRPLAAALAMLWMVRALGPQIGTPLAGLLLQVALGAVCYVAALLALWFACSRPAGAEAQAMTMVEPALRRAAAALQRWRLSRTI